MLTHSKRNKIAPVSIFFLLYISRVVVSQTNAQSVTSGIMRTDMLICVLAAMALNLIFSLPALWCYKNNKNPFDVKLVNVFYFLYFIFLAGINISRFSSFAASVLNPEASAWTFSVIIAVCVCYAACLGLEGLSRFSAFAFILIVLALAAGLLWNIENYNEINLYPVIVNDKMSMLKSILYMTGNSSEVVILLCLGKKINGDAVKPFVFSVTGAFLTSFLLMLFVNATMGDAATMNAFPIYTLYQLARVGSFERLDVLLISFWMFGVFTKSVLLVYCSSLSIKSYRNITKCIVSSVLSLAVALVFTEVLQSGNVSPLVFVIPYGVFCVLIPLLTLIFKKRNRGEELIEKF